MMIQDTTAVGMHNGENDKEKRTPTEKQNPNSPSIPPAKTPSQQRGSFRFLSSAPKKQWHDVENIVYPFDTDDGETLACFELLRDDGVSCEVLYALATIIGKYKGMSLVSASEAPEQEGAYVVVMGSFLIGSTPYNVKLSMVELLMTEVLPPVGGLEEDELTVQDTLDYLLGREFGWNRPVHSEIDLFSKLREVCRVLKERAIQAAIMKREAVARVVKGGDVAANAISKAALAVESGLSQSVPVLTGGIGIAGDSLKHVIQSPEKEPPKTKSTVVASVYTDAAKRATDGVRVGTRAAALGIRDASTRGITNMSQRFEEENMGEKLVPDKNKRDVLAAAGKVGVASLGAVAIVGEAVFETTSAVLKKTASVTADVVRHKYGDSAGQIVQDASDTTGNVMRTVSQVAMLESKVLTKAVAKNTGKVQIKQSQQTPPQQIEGQKLQASNTETTQDADKRKKETPSLN